MDGLKNWNSPCVAGYHKSLASLNHHISRVISLILSHVSLSFSRAVNVIDECSPAIEFDDLERAEIFRLNAIVTSFDDQSPLDKLGETKHTSSRRAKSSACLSNSSFRAGMFSPGAKHWMARPLSRNSSLIFCPGFSALFYHIGVPFLPAAVLLSGCRTLHSSG